MFSAETTIVAVLIFVAAILGAEFADPEHPARKEPDANR